MLEVLTSGSRYGTA